MSKEAESPPTAVFQENEKVLCHHKNLIYEAKVWGIKDKFENDDTVGPFYLIHYAGWSKKWDEYVPASRLLKHNEENLKLQAEMKAKQPGKKGTGKSMGSKKTGDALKQVDTDVSGPSTPTGHDEEQSGAAPKSKQTSQLDTAPLKRKLSVSEALTSEEEEEVEPKKLDEAEFEALIPEAIKHILFEDYDRINRRKMLHKVPARQSIGYVLEEFIEHLKGKGTPIPPLYPTCVQVMKDNITHGLNTRLLYESELEHFGKVVERMDTNQHKDEDPEFDNFELLPYLYGPYHLIRLCSNIGGIMNDTVSADDIPVEPLKAFLRDLYEYVVSRSDDLFVPELDYAS